jgi:hypothetical protein
MHREMTASVSAADHASNFNAMRLLLLLLVLLLLLLQLLQLLRTSLALHRQPER